MPLLSFLIKKLEKTALIWTMSLNCWLIILPLGILWQWVRMPWSCTPFSPNDSPHYFHTFKCYTAICKLFNWWFWGHFLINWINGSIEWLLFQNAFTGNNLWVYKLFHIVCGEDSGYFDFSFLLKVSNCNSTSQSQLTKCIYKFKLLKCSYLLFLS